MEWYVKETSQGSEKVSAFGPFASFQAAVDFVSLNSFPWTESNLMRLTIEKDSI